MATPPPPTTTTTLTYSQLQAKLVVAVGLVTDACFAISNQCSDRMEAESIKSRMTNFLTSLQYGSITTQRNTKRKRENVDAKQIKKQKTAMPTKSQDLVDAQKVSIEFNNTGTVDEADFTISQVHNSICNNNNVYDDRMKRSLDPTIVQPYRTPLHLYHSKEEMKFMYNNFIIYCRERLRFRMTHKASGCTNGSHPLWLGSMPIQLFAYFKTQEASAAPCYTTRRRSRNRPNGFKEDIFFVGWSFYKQSYDKYEENWQTDDGDLQLTLCKLGDWNWIYRNYEDGGSIYRCRCNSIEFVYFANTQMVRADITYDAERFNHENNSWDLVVFGGQKPISKPHAICN